MGEKGALSEGKQESLVEQSGEKLLGFGKGLFKRGKELAGDLKSKAENLDLEQARGAMVEKLSSIDLERAARESAKVLAKPGNKELAAAAAGTLGFGFPQLAILEKGAGQLGDLIASKQARSLLEQPQKMADSFTSSFDEFDREKSGFLDDQKLRRLDGLSGIGSSQKASALILRSGYSVFNSLDGSADKEGISKRDLEVFSLMQNKDLLSAYANKRANEQGIAWGAAAGGTVFAGAYLKEAGFKFTAEALKSAGPGRISALALGSALLVGGAVRLLSKQQQETFYQEKEAELQKLFSAMKNSF